MRKEPISWIMELLKRPRQASALVVATWNCATLNAPDRISALHNRSTLLGKADIVLLQEMRLASPSSLPQSNPFLRLHHPFATVAHQAVLGHDTGILIRNTNWRVEDRKIGDYFTYAKIRIPANEPAFGTDTRLLHVWSIHAPPHDTSRRAFWDCDAPNLSILDAAAPGEHSAAIIGADWNAVHSPMIDNFPPVRDYIGVMPLGQLAQAGLVDSFRTLHPNSAIYTRHHVVRGQLVSA